ncbi:MAG TPA: hypothetical protein VIM98_09885 [Dyella sp.]|uniref:hypothetical protein n=1 Tax=Dyella sp. TaxID=1869338 RepID=UPI002F9310AD
MISLAKAVDPHVPSSSDTGRAGESGGNSSTQSGSTHVNVPVKQNAATSTADSSITSGTESAVVKELLKLIQQLEKLLARQEQELASASAHNHPGDSASLTRITAAQLAVTNTLGRLEQAMQALSQALLKAGDSSSGSLLDTSA